MKKKLHLVTLCALITACGKTSKDMTLKEIATEVIPVKTILIGNYSSINKVEGSGLISTENEATYSFKIGGVIEDITIEEGQYFKKGQLLAKLKSTEINAQLAQSKMGFEKAERDYVRTYNLYKDSVATLEQLQNAKTALDIAKKSVEVVDFNFNYARIYAKSDGFVTKKMANEGEIVATGNPILLINELRNKNDWILKVGVTDKAWAKVTKGQEARISIDAYPNKEFQGVVLRKSLSSDKNNGSYQIEIKLIDPKGALAVGMFAKASIEIAINDEFPIIPYEALIEADGNKAMVFIPDSNKVKKVPIVIADFNDQGATVKSGLENYSEIITSNSAFLNENSSIK